VKHFSIPALTALALSAGALQAAPFTVDYQYSNDVFGAQDWYAPVTIDSPVYDGTYNAGRFELTSSTLGDFLAFCIEVTQAISPGNTYEDTPTLFSSAVATNIENLFNNSYDLVTDGLTAAGFQVALWEIVEDTSTGIDLSSGEFSAVDAWVPGVVSTAQGFLNNLSAAPNDQFDIRFFASPESQDVVTANRIPAAVPLPATGLLLLSAGGLLLTRRKKS